MVCLPARHTSKELKKANKQTAVEIFLSSRFDVKLCGSAMRKPSLYIDAQQQQQQYAYTHFLEPCLPHTCSCLLVLLLLLLVI